MKIRQGFVSNSSSSSFIIMSGEPSDSFINSLNGQTFTLGKNGGETDFGWQQEEYSDFESKANWAALMTGYFGDDVGLWRFMLEKVIKEVTGAAEVLFDIESGYIDHQSVEGDNASMFASEEALKQWLFSPQSYISNDNDNH